MLPKSRSLEQVKHAARSREFRRTTDTQPQPEDDEVKSSVVDPPTLAGYGAKRDLRKVHRQTVLRSRKNPSATKDEGCRSASRTPGGLHGASEWSIAVNV